MVTMSEKVAFNETVSSSLDEKGYIFVKEILSLSKEVHSFPCFL